MQAAEILRGPDSFAAATVTTTRAGALSTSGAEHGSNLGRQFRHLFLSIGAMTGVARDTVVNWKQTITQEVRHESPHSP